jgi:hypothetical protein
MAKAASRAAKVPSRPAGFEVTGFTHRRAEAWIDLRIPGGSDDLMVRLESRYGYRPGIPVTPSHVVQVRITVGGREVTIDEPDVLPGDVLAIIAGLIYATHDALRDDVMPTLPEDSTALLEKLYQVLQQHGTVLTGQEDDS